MRIPPAITDVELLRVHEEVYIRRFFNGELTRKEMLRIGIPWSEDFVTRSRYSCGATREACLAARRDGIAMNLAGGSHHAFADRGEGYCVFNDCAVAARVMQTDGLADRILIIDCDVHQGNGTAAIFREDATVFTFSIHGEKNFPFDKERSDLDVALKDHTGDEGYLAALARGLSAVSKRFKPDFVIYIAGADPYKEDRYGRLSLTKKGLCERDRMVLAYCGARGLSIAVTMGGGYAPKVEETVAIQLQTVRLCAEYARESKGVTGRRLKTDGSPGCV